MAHQWGSCLTTTNWACRCCGRFPSAWFTQNSWASADFLNSAQLEMMAFAPSPCSRSVCMRSLLLYNNFPIDRSYQAIKQCQQNVNSKSQTVIAGLRLSDTDTRWQKTTSFPKSCIFIFWVNRHTQNFKEWWRMSKQYCISVVVCRIVLTMRTLHCALCLVTFLLTRYVCLSGQLLPKLLPCPLHFQPVHSLLGNLSMPHLQLL